MTKSKSPLDAISECEREVMARLLHMRPEQHKAAPKPANARAEAQRRRRGKERRPPTATIFGD